MSNQTFKYTSKDFLELLKENSSIPPNVKLRYLMNNCRNYDRDQVIHIQSMEKNPSYDKDDYQKMTGKFVVDIPKFIDCYKSVLELNHNAFMSYTENPIMEGCYSPLMFDIDISMKTKILPQQIERNSLYGYTEFFPKQKGVPELYTEKELALFAKCCIKTVTEEIVYTDSYTNKLKSVPDSSLICYVLTKPPYISNNKIKHGLHIHFPFITIKDSKTLNPYEYLISKLQRVWDSIGAIKLNSGADIEFDPLINSAPWLLYGSGKSPDAGRYLLEQDKDRIFKYDSKANTFDRIKVISLKKSFENKYIKEYDYDGNSLIVPLSSKDESFFPYLFGRYKSLSLNGGIEFQYKPETIEYLQGSSDNYYEEDEYDGDRETEKTLNYSPIELKSIVESLIDIIDEDYATECKTWYPIFCSIKYLFPNNTGKELAIKFSSKTTGEEHDVIKNDWNRVKLNKINSQSHALNIIRKYAKQSNYKKYKSLNLTRPWKKFEVRSTDPQDIAKDALPLLKGKFLFVTIGDNKKEAYQLQDLLWIKLDDSTIYNRIASILAEADIKYEDDYNDHLEFLELNSDEKDEEEELPKKRKVGRPKKDNKKEDKDDFIIKSLKDRRKIFKSIKRFNEVIKILEGVDYLLDDKFIKRFDEVPTRILQRDGTIYDMIKGCVDDPKEGETFVVQSQRIIKSDLSECEEATKYMDTVLGKERTDFMTWLGYCFTGLPLKKCCIVLGRAGTGKTQFFNFVEQVLESRFRPLNKEEIMASTKKTSRSATDAGLIYAIEKGSTLAYVPEFDSDQKLELSLIKILIGERGKALNQKYEKFKKYANTSKLVICSNYSPKYDSSDDISNKFLYYEFKNCFEKKGKDTGLMNTLLKDENFLDEFYTICIHYAGKVLREELPEPIGDINEANYQQGDTYHLSWFKNRLVKMPTDLDDDKKFNGENSECITSKVLFRLNIGSAYTDYCNYVYHCNGVLDDCDTIKNNIKGKYTKEAFEDFLKYECGDNCIKKSQNNLNFIGKVCDDNEKFEYEKFSLMKITSSKYVHKYQIKSVLKYFSFYDKKDEEKISKQEKIDEIKKQMELLAKQLKELEENN